MTLFEIQTPRLRLLALEADQLEQAWKAPARLEAELGLRLSRAVITPVVERAIRSKLARLARAPQTEHVWLTYWLLVIQAEAFGSGLAGFKGVPNAAGETEIGYGIDPAAQGHGYMTEAVRGLAEWAFTRPECRAITARQVRPDNLASQHVLSNNGFRQTGETDGMQDWRLDAAR